MVVHSPEPSFQVHHSAMEFGEIASFFARRYAYQVLEGLGQWAIAGPLVGGNFRAGGDVVLHETAQGCGIGIGYLPCVQPGHALFLFLDADHYQPLGPVLPSPHPLLLSAEHSFVHLGRTGYGMVARTLHGLHHLALESPAGLLPKVKLAGEFRRGDAFFVGRDEVHDIEGL